MAKTLGGWKRVKYSGDKPGQTGEIAHYKEIVTYGTGVVTDCIFSEFGPAINNADVPQPPAGVDWTVLFIQNDTMSAAGDIVLQGAEKTGGTFATLKDDLIAYAASSAGSTATAATYTQQPGLTPTGGRTPVFRFFQDDDGLHSASTGTAKTAEIHLMWVVPPGTKYGGQRF